MIEFQKTEFINRFVTQFIATANHYDEYCNAGTPEKLYNPPVEDEVDMAENVYELTRDI